MSNALVPAEESKTRRGSTADAAMMLSSMHGIAAEDERQFVTMEIAGQLFGIPVLLVEDVLRPQRVTPIPLAPSSILGSLNLRGRIVTVIDVRKKLGLESIGDTNQTMNVVVERDGEQYSLVVDKVGEVLNLPQDQFEANPSNLSPEWQEVSMGVYRLKERLMLVLDVANLLQFE